MKNHSAPSRVHPEHLIPPPRRILFVTHASGLDRRSGGAVYACNFIGILAKQNCELGLLVLRPNASDPVLSHYPWKLARLRVRGGLRLGNRVLRGTPAELLHALTKPFSRHWAARLHRAVSLIGLSRPLTSKRSWNSPLNEAERALLTREVADFKPDYILFNHYFIADYRPASSRILIGILTHELFFDRQTAIETAGRSFEMPGYTPESERRILAQADHLLAINHRDAQIMKEAFPDMRVDTAHPSLATNPLPLPQELETLLFVGGEAEHNVDAIHWLLNQIWPAIHRRRPAARLLICGGICRRLSTPTIEGVIMRGVVDDLQPEYARCALVLVPLRIGSGLKTRIIEAFSYGRAVVTTPIGLQGMEFAAPAAVNAIDAEDLVEQTLSLLNDTQRLRTMSEVALNIVESHFSADATLATLRPSPLFTSSPQ